MIATAEDSAARFVAAFPEYARTAKLDDFRHREFARLEREGHVYLDYTGGGLYGESQVRRHMEMLLGSVLGNPHSTNPTSAAATHFVESCRRRVLDFFHADPGEYVAIFTANASQALKLVGEAYPFEPGDRFLLTFDNHNSVNGIREFDRARGAETIYVPVTPPELRVDEAALERELARARPGGHNLFAYPAQSNFSGVQHPLSWITRAQEQGWDVLLDAAAFVPTNRLDLREVHPDFVALSFYKMFGYPTGVGALLARRSALAKLHRPWFAGGTITVASVQADIHTLAEGEAAFEDGTLNYAILPAVEYGLDLLESAGVECIHERVLALTGWLLAELAALRHGNGAPVVRVYGPATTEHRGGTVTLNFYDASGHFIDHPVIERRASEYQISLRTGCFCNPGAGELALGLSKGELFHCMREVGDNVAHITYDDFRRCIDDKSTGAVRVSFGWASTFADAEAFLAFAREMREPKI
ncbi:MAG: aminotransferase class V-fold PLP-dependent enzyme [Thermoanaerobaculia bacterium]